MGRFGGDRLDQAKRWAGDRKKWTAGLTSSLLFWFFFYLLLQNNFGDMRGKSRV
jgi:hypothetical protein